MASTNKTNKLKLSQFLGTDKPAWLTDYNADMQKIDDGYKKQADDIAGLDGRTTDLESGLNNSDAAIVDIQNDIQSLKDEDVIIKRDINTLSDNYDVIHHETAVNAQEIAGIKPYATVSGNNKVNLYTDNVQQLNFVRNAVESSDNTYDIISVVNNGQESQLITSQTGLIKQLVSGSDLTKLWSIALGGLCNEVQIGSSETGVFFIWSVKNANYSYHLDMGSNESGAGLTFYKHNNETGENTILITIQQ